MYSSWTAAGYKNKSSRKKSENMRQPGRWRGCRRGLKEEHKHICRCSCIVATPLKHQLLSLQRRDVLWQAYIKYLELHRRWKVRRVASSCLQLAALLASSRRCRQFHIITRSLWVNQASHARDNTLSKGSLYVFYFANCWNENSSCTENDGCIWTSALRFLLLLFPCCCLLSPVLIWQLVH